jgi:hypothetical protein
VIKTVVRPGSHSTGRNMAFLKWRQVTMLLAKMKLFMLLRRVAAERCYKRSLKCEELWCLTPYCFHLHSKVEKRRRSLRVLAFLLACLFPSFLLKGPTKSSWFHSVNLLHGKILIIFMTCLKRQTSETELKGQYGLWEFKFVSFLHISTTNKFWEEFKIVLCFKLML